eukprot:SAG31_NODE_3389_length_4328_cov_4.670449_5_plen_243_part_01
MPVIKINGPGADGSIRPTRDPTTGLCIECLPGEHGELLGPIDAKDVASQFEGYANDSTSTDEKILRNVFAKGDCWFRSGDIMSRDPDGFYYFGDRAGDTFRWRGENVSTTEVEKTVALNSCILDSCCYGVSVPNNDGKAGMLAAVLSSHGAESSCMQGAATMVPALYDQLMADLPDYAVPTFLRITGAIPTTETHKHQKAKLVTDGFDPNKCQEDVIYVRQRRRPNEENGQGGYMRLTPQLHA